MAWRSGNPANLTFVLGWISVGLFGVAAILALIGLSDPRRERGKLWGLLTLVLLLAAGVGLIVQVRHYAESQGASRLRHVRPAEASPGHRRKLRGPGTRNLRADTRQRRNPTT